ncbi:hypothetical protein LX36DRAFT_41865 [Colletotrichum falcatum]|nr:hypothetical protein LX36DRAFT_41865 [Colletotrichum falcatum]
METARQGIRYLSYTGLDLYLYAYTSQFWQNLARECNTVTKTRLIQLMQGSQMVFCPFAAIRWRSLYRREAKQRPQCSFPRDRAGPSHRVRYKNALCRTCHSADERLLRYKLHSGHFTRVLFIYAGKLGFLLESRTTLAPTSVIFDKGGQRLQVDACLRPRCAS